MAAEVRLLAEGLERGEVEDELDAIENHADLAANIVGMLEHGRRGRHDAVAAGAVAQEEGAGIGRRKRTRRRRSSPESLHFYTRRDRGGDEVDGGQNGPMTEREASGARMASAVRGYVSDRA